MPSPGGVSGLSYPRKEDVIDRPDIKPPYQYNAIGVDYWTRVQKPSPGKFEMWARWKPDHSDIEVHVGPLEARMSQLGNLIHDNAGTNVVNVKRTDSQTNYGPGPLKIAPETIDIGIYTTRQGWAGSREPNARLAQVTLTPVSARLLATALTEQANAIQAELDAKKVAGHVVTVFIPADRADNPAHAKNLAACALRDYRSNSGPIVGVEVYEAEPLTVAEKQKRGQ